MRQDSSYAGDKKDHNPFCRKGERFFALTEVVLCRLLIFDAADRHSVCIMFGGSNNACVVVIENAVP